MAPTALRHPALALGVIAALGAGIAAPAATAATSEPVPQVAQRGLLGDLLGGITGPITGPLGLDQVVDIVDALTETVVPTQVADLLEVLTLDQLTQIVKPETILPLLQGLVPTLTSLSGGGSAAPTAQVEDVLQQLTAILRAGAPGDAAGQAALSGILDQVTSLLGLPGVRELPVVGDLVTVLEGVVDQLPDALKTPIQGLITAAAGTPKPGTGGTVTDPTLAALLALLGGGAKTPAPAAPAPAPAAKPAGTTAKKVVRAKISSVKLSKNRKTLTVRVTCPATAATTGCRIAPKATLAGKSVKLSGSKSVKRGKAGTLKGRVAASTVKKLRAKGGKAVVRVTTTGSTSGAVSKTIRIRRAAR